MIAAGWPSFRSARRSSFLPKDGTATVAANGIPEVWEILHGGSLDPAGDVDTGPSASTLVGDGIATFDEYRGFIESGKQVRSDPRQKDLFVHVVNPADTVNGVFVTSPVAAQVATGAARLPIRRPPQYRARGSRFRPPHRR
jgi:hypothetical protein